MASINDLSLAKGLTAQVECRILAPQARTQHRARQGRACAAPHPSLRRRPRRPGRTACRDHNRCLRYGCAEFSSPYHGAPEETCPGGGTATPLRTDRAKSARGRPGQRLCSLATQPLACGVIDPELGPSTRRRGPVPAAGERRCPLACIANSATRRS